MPSIVIQVPDTLSGGADRLESLYDLIQQVKVGQSLALDLSLVTWIRPPGLIALLVFTRFATQITHSKVYFFGCRSDVAAYLERVNFYQACHDWTYTSDSVPADKVLSRSEASTSLLELAAITTPDDVRRIADRTSGIVTQWLSFGSLEQTQLILILSEMCENICEHARDTGHVAIQRYRRPRLGYTEVRIAIGDMGRGIRQSLTEVHGEFGSEPIDYVLAALNGRSARGPDRTGNGFLNVRNVVQRNSGSIYVRSETCAVQYRSNSPDPLLYPNLRFVPGTQVAIVLAQKTQ